MSTPDLDALVLVFTRGVSLVEWRATGLLEREWALYEGLRPHYGSIVVVTWGGREDLAVDLGPGVTVIANEAGQAEEMYAAGLPARVRGVLSGRSGIVVKTNQMSAGDSAVRIAAELRRGGARVGLIARGGYLWSRAVAREAGSGSAAAIAAARAEGDLCRAADVVVGTTHEMLDDLAWRYTLDASRGALIPNYVLDDAPVGAASGRKAAEVLYAGRLGREKRVDLIVEACARLRGAVEPAITLRVVGDGPEETRLRARARELGVDAVFEHRLPHRELLERMSRCTVYAQASEYEGHPKTVLEAMACGAAVVVCDTPGLGDVVQHAVTGLRCPPAPEAMARMIEGLLADADWRESLGMRAAEETRARLSLSKILGVELAAHRRALAGGARAAGEPEVRWTPEILDGSHAARAGAFERSIRGVARRLPAREAATFLMELDSRLYTLQGEVASQANGGLHPKHELIRYHDFFTDRIGKGERIADLGCGVGALAFSIAERCRAAVSGMDLSEKNLELARARAREGRLEDRMRFAKGDITRDRLEGGFDAVVLSNVLEHITERPARLRLWREWYNPGRFLIRVPAFDREWRAPFKRNLGVEWRLDPTHETEYTQEQLERELREAGLTITHTTIRWGEFWVEAA